MAKGKASIGHDAEGEAIISGAANIQLVNGGSNGSAVATVTDENGDSVNDTISFFGSSEGDDYIVSFEGTPDGQDTSFTIVVNACGGACLRNVGDADSSASVTLSNGFNVSEVGIGDNRGCETEGGGGTNPSGGTPSNTQSSF